MEARRCSPVRSCGALRSYAAAPDPTSLAQPHTHCFMWAALRQGVTLGGGQVCGRSRPDPARGGAPVRRAGRAAGGPDGAHCVLVHLALSCPTLY